MIHLEKASSGKFLQKITIGQQLVYADLNLQAGGDDAAPGPHDLFDSALAACKALTVSLYAERKGIPLAGVKIDVIRDDSREKNGEYVLNVKLELLGELTIEQQQMLLKVAEKCPVHKLMMQSTISIHTELV